MPFRKFARVRAALETEGPAVDPREPERASDADLLRVHTTESVQAMVTSEPRAMAPSQSFLWSAELAEGSVLDPTAAASTTCTRP
jgi:hypothetical protein